MDELIFSDGILTEIFAHVLEEYPMECCGVLLGKKNQKRQLILDAVKTENHSGNLKNRSFRIFPRDFFQIEKNALQRNLEVVGFYHSHPEGNSVLSEEDIRYMIPDVSYPVISVRKNHSGKDLLTIRSYKKKSLEEIEEEKILCR